MGKEARSSFLGYFILRSNCRYGLAYASRYSCQKRMYWLARLIATEEKIADSCSGDDCID